MIYIEYSLYYFFWQLYTNIKNSDAQRRKSILYTCHLFNCALGGADTFYACAKVVRLGIDILLQFCAIIYVILRRYNYKIFVYYVKIFLNEI